MKNEQNKETQNLQQKSHETLLKLLNNIGIVGTIIISIVDIICVIIFVYGIKIDVEKKSMIIYSILNSCIGVSINILLRYQGQRYAELENKEICDKFHRKKIKETKHYIPMFVWQILSSIKDVIIKGGTVAFNIFGIIYISINGSKNPVQILITMATLMLFICLGLVNMNSAYCRFYSKELPHMELKIKEKEEKENATL